MTRSYRFFSSSLLTALLSTSLLAAPAPNAPAAKKGPQGPKEKPTFADVAYGTDPKQKLDVYLPPGDGPFPVVIWYHGGGWFAGDKVTNATEPAPYFKIGCAVVSAEYRLVDDAVKEGIVPPVAAVLGDNRRALQFVRLHAADWHLDPNRIIVAGGSAGGGTAVYLGSEGEQANPASSDPVERVSTKVQGVLGFVPAPTTLDPQRIQQYNPGVIWGYWCFEPGDKNRSSQAEYDHWMADRDKWMPDIRKYSSDMILGPGAPPFFLQYGEALPAPGAPYPPKYDKVHSPHWGVAFQKVAKSLGDDVQIQWPGKAPEHDKNSWAFIERVFGLPVK